MPLDLWPWSLAAAGAFLVGLGKGGLAGVGNFAIALFALIFPAKESVGILLPVLLSADLVAVAVYRRHARWPYLRRLLPWTAVGVVGGYWVMDEISDTGVRTLIGAILLGMTGIHFFRRWQTRDDEMEGDPFKGFSHTLMAVAFAGILTGLATMVANAAGPITALYFLTVGLPKLAFIGTGAWFFLLVNLFKMPFQVALENITWASMGFSLSLVPLAVLGALIAPFIIQYINQKLFEFLIWFFIVIAGVKLLF